MSRPRSQTPERHAPSYWIHTAGRELQGVRPLPGDQTVEVAIIGGGYTGLAAAHRLVKVHGVNAAVLEARQIGWGASSRNGGFVSVFVGKEVPRDTPVTGAGLPRFPFPFLRRLYLAGAYAMYGLKDRWS